MNDLTHVPCFRFILQSEFPLNALILATEALRIANQNSGRQLFDWSLSSLSGDDVRASNGMWLNVDHALNELPTGDYYFVFEGNLPTQNNSLALLHKLRDAHRSGATVVGIDTGAFALAQAGLAGADVAVVVHWEAAAAFQERFAPLSACDCLFQADGRVLSCAGGVATLDLMLELIRRHYGDALASEVGNALVYRPREGGQAQLRSDQDAIAGEASNTRSLSNQLLGLMRKNLDFPLSASRLAAELGVSLSTLERHCQRHFGHTPMRLYLGVRLQAARNLLFYQDHSIKDVALAYGFSSPAVFSRTFKTYFGQTPSAFRNSVRDRQSSTQLPEVRRLYATRSSISSKS